MKLVYAGHQSDIFDDSTSLRVKNRQDVLQNRRGGQEKSAEMKAWTIQSLRHPVESLKIRGFHSNFSILLCAPPVEETRSSLSPNTSFESKDGVPHEPGVAWRGPPKPFRAPEVAIWRLFLVWLVTRNSWIPLKYTTHTLWHFNCCSPLLNFKCVHLHFILSIFGGHRITVTHRVTARVTHGTGDLEIGSFVFVSVPSSFKVFFLSRSKIMSFICSMAKDHGPLPCYIGRHSFPVGWLILAYSPIINLIGVVLAGSPVRGRRLGIGTRPWVGKQCPLHKWHAPHGFNEDYIHINACHWTPRSVGLDFLCFMQLGDCMPSTAALPYGNLFLTSKILRKFVQLEQGSNLFHSHCWLFEVCNVRPNCIRNEGNIHRWYCSMVHSGSKTVTARVEALARNLDRSFIISYACVLFASGGTAKSGDPGCSQAALWTRFLSTVCRGRIILSMLLWCRLPASIEFIQ
jgi:hypothetical protein